MKHLYSVSLIIISFICQMAFANTSVESSDSLFNEAVVIKRKAPSYPRSENIARKEGWVIVSYIIDKNGKVKDPIIEDSSGVKAFEKSTTKAIKKWKYKPATLNGKPVEQCRTELKMVFQFQDSKTGVTKEFYKEYNKALRLIQEKDLGKAKKVISNIGHSPRWNLSEDAHYWLLKSAFYRVTKNEDEELSSLKRAIGYEGIYLPEKAYISALKNLYVIQANSRKYVDALNTSEKLEKFIDADESIQKIIDDANDIKSQISAARVLASNAVISDEESFRHELMRNEFSFHVDSGKVTTFDLRCSRHRAEFSITEGEKWDIPADWGRCKIYVYGEKGSTFQIYEYQSETDQLSQEGISAEASEIIN